MGIKDFVKDNCPDSLFPLLKRAYYYVSAVCFERRILQYLPYYQDELSRDIVRYRLRYSRTIDKNVFLDLAERCGNLHEYQRRIKFSGENFGNIVIVLDNDGGNDLRYMQRLMSPMIQKDKCRVIRFKDFLKEPKISDDDFIICLLTGRNMEKFRRFMKKNKLLNKFESGPLCSGRSDEQYLDVFAPVDDEIIIDAGAYDGKTALRFLKWGEGKVKHVYSFELDPANVPKCEENLKGHEDKVTLINKGTWSKNGRIYITPASAGSHVSDRGTVEAGLTSIDDIVRDEKVTFIKMDVEGAELESLKGAKNTIIKNHPRLAICAYHKNSDLYELPEYILSLVPEYKFYLRHYSSREWETVLYAFVN